MKDNSGKIILALLAGASAGIVAGLLMAPDSGTVSRDNLKKYAGKLSKDLEKAVQDNLGKLKDINAGAILGSAGSMLGLSKTEGGGEAGTYASATGSAAGRTGTDASAGSAPKTNQNPTGAGPEVGEDA